MSENTQQTKHILCINHEFPPSGGGAATATLHIARALVHSGIPVTVLTGQYGKRPSREHVDGIDIWRIPALRARDDKSNPWEMITFLLSACWWALRHGRCMKGGACIAFFGLPAGPAAWILRAVWGVPYVVSLRGGDVPGFLPSQLDRWHRLTGGCIRWLWKHAIAVVANSAGLAQLARRRGHKIAVIPNGVDVAAFVPPSDRKNASTVTHFLHVGRLNKQKSLETLLHALPLVHSAWHLSLAGDGPEATPLKELAHNLGLSERISFLGWQERTSITHLYQSADVFVFPSVEEGMPNAMLEAMSCGLPVVACAVCGCDELVAPEHTGLLVPPQEPARLAAALQRMCDRPEERQRMGIAGRECVQRRFSWTNTAQAYARICGITTPAGP